jgi:hypothetical protein
MPTNNAINLNAVGIPKYDGAGTFTAITLTQYSPLIGGASNAITSLGPLTNGQLVIGSTGVVPVAAAITPGTGVSITNGAGSIQLDIVGGGMTWTVETNNLNMAVNHGYGSNKAGALAFTLPAASAVGDTIAIVGMQGSWNVIQAANQRIFIGSSASTLGAGGSIASTNAFDAITLVCLVANLLWYARSVQGNITIA